MKKLFLLGCLILTNIFPLFSQTDSTLLKQYTNIDKWITPRYQIDSIYQHYFNGNIMNFIIELHKKSSNTRIRNHWANNYLVSATVSKNHVNITFKNNPLDKFKESISDVFESHKHHWTNNEPITFNFIIANCALNKNPLKDKALIANPFHVYSMYDFETYIQLHFEEKDELLQIIKELEILGEYEGAIYYAKVLSWREPFNLKINNKLRTLLKYYNNNDH